MAKNSERKQALNKAVGGRVRLARLEAGISQADLGRALSFKQPGVLMRYEKGERGFDYEQLAVISKAINKSIDWLVFGDEGHEGHETVPEAGSNIVSITKARPEPLERGRGLAMLPQPIVDLWNLGFCNPLSHDDLRYLRRHLDEDGSPNSYDMEVALRGYRLTKDGSDENFRLLQEANRRRREALGMKKLKESELPPSSPPTQAQGPKKGLKKAKDDKH